MQACIYIEERPGFHGDLQGLQRAGAAAPCPAEREEARRCDLAGLGATDRPAHPSRLRAACVLPHATRPKWDGKNTTPMMNLGVRAIFTQAKIPKT